LSIASIGPYRVRSWPEGAVVFDVRLGDTHALNGALAAVFQAFHGHAALSREALGLPQAEWDEALAQLALRHLLEG
jgi:hypothetical protein